jgi:FMN hydrolase / 5-amino-6-(5-phospho-D-ribitylamino)uracil phosphatase
VTPYPEVIPELRVLRRRYCLVSVTNGNADVERTLLRGCFDLSLTAAHVGAWKPAPDLFRRAMEATGMRPECSVHVGDDPELDMQAARRAGMRVVWMNRDGAAWPQHLRVPDGRIGDLRGLRRWLAQTTGSPA